jgi:5-methylcytosine-specific restriction protein B
MAVIARYFPTESVARRHPTEVDCGWQVVQTRGGPLLQLSTYGSQDRESSPKVSQTLQLDAQRSEELMRIIAQAFPGILARLSK